LGRVLYLRAHGGYPQNRGGAVGDSATPPHRPLIMKEPAMNTAKREAESLIAKLPEDCSLEDIQYHLYVLEKIRNGTRIAEEQGTVTHEEAEKRLERWRAK